MKKLRRLLAVLFLLLSLAVGGLLLLAGTDRGTQVGIAALVRLLEPRLAVTGLEGNLLRGLSMGRLAWKGPGLELSLEELRLRWVPGELLERRFHLLELSAARAVVQLPPATAETGTGPTVLPEVDLPLDLVLDRIRLGQLRLVREGVAPQVLGPLELSLAGAASRLEIRRLEVDHAEGRVSLAGEVKLHGRYPLWLESQWYLRREEGELQGSTRVEGDLDELAVVLETRGLAHLRGEGVLTRLLDEPGFRLHLQSPGVALGALVPALAGWRIAGRIEASGDFQRMILRGNLEVETPLASVPARIDLDAGLAGRKLTLRDAEVRMAGSRLRLTGTATLEAVPKWTLELVGEALDPALFAADYPGRIDLETTSRGRLGTAPEGELVIRQLRGTLRDHPLEGKGTLRLARGQLQVEGLELASGDNRLQAEGALGERLQLDFRLRAENLAQLAPGVEGRLEGAGRLRGSPDAPRIELQLTGEGLKGEGLSAKSLELEADYLHAPGGPLSLDLVGRGLVLAGQREARLRLQLTGSRSRPRLTLEVEEPASGRSLRLGAAGELDEAFRFRGELEQLALADPRSGRWELERPVPLEVAWPRVRLEGVCLAREAARFCAAYRADAPDRWQAWLDLAAFDLALLQPLLEPGTVLKGRLEGQVRLHALGGKPEGRVALHAPDAALRLEGFGEPLRLDLGGASLDGTLDDEGFDAEVKLPLGELGGIDGSLKLPGWSLGRSAVEQPLAGHLEGEVRSLALVEHFLPQLAAVKGGADLDLRLGGSLAAPRLMGEVRTRELSFEIPALGLVMDRVDLALRGDERGRVEYEGTVIAGGGRLQLSGGTRLEPAAGWPTELRLRSRRFPLVRTREYQAMADSELELKYDHRGLWLEGSVSIPEATIRPRALPEGAVPPSPDVVILGEETPRPALPLHAKVDLVLGRRVRVKAFRLEGRVTGHLTLVENPGQPTLGRGELQLLDGSYELFGKKLEIRRGRLLFAEGPVTNPGLDIDLVREIEVENLVVGARVGGTLKKPSFSLHSDPALPDAEILSYLTTGHGSGSRGGNLDLSNQALMLASGQILGRVGERIGLDQLKLEEGEEGALSLAMGYWLSPRVYMEYVAGLRKEGNSVRLRYEINDRLQLQTESGNTQAVDLFYTFER